MGCMWVITGMHTQVDRLLNGEIDQGTRNGDDYNMWVTGQEILIHTRTIRIECNILQYDAI